MKTLFEGSLEDSGLDLVQKGSKPVQILSDTSEPEESSQGSAADQSSSSDKSDVSGSDSSEKSSAGASEKSSTSSNAVTEQQGQ